MNHTLGKRNTAGAARLVPAAALDQASIVEAYRRWAGVYDTVFGGVSSKGRLRAVALANRLPGTDVLEVGVGTGLALPHYKRD
jgi:phosphatidylethanolamine/phosphatidyl-N-methylethanolamine N-methyltransferase